MAKHKVEEAFEDRMEDIRTLYYAKNQEIKRLGSLDEYGLSIDFIEAGTFEDQREPYYRYQLSWGGPQEEFRVFLNGDVEFWYLDWSEGGFTPVKGEDAEIIIDILRQYFVNFPL